MAQKKLKNYTTKVPANRSIQEIQEALAGAGASGVMMDFDPPTGNAVGLTFAIDVNGRFLNYKLPVDLDKFRQALLSDGVHRAQNDEGYVYRVAWRCVRDWVMAQMALIKTEMAKLDQVFLPYAIAQNGATVYHALTEGNSQLLLGKGQGDG